MASMDSTTPPPQSLDPGVQWNVTTVLGLHSQTVLRSDPQVCKYLYQLNDRMAKKDRMINALRKDVHMVATAIRLRTPLPSRDRYRLPSPRWDEGKNAHVKDRLGKRMEDPEFILRPVLGAGRR
ncbi:hypothetical protein RHMOL_Rhmol07G0089000 [Rhododendron molle]|uniref:Uncharacterized protein n=1 Tax=Rhododendron molle TaxID=49168 RepID=A0ACC0N027_RHOML|nr:hypothetical protein RHMOL_Rhmol07G0089000 [Rhododendron molle]